MFEQLNHEMKQRNNSTSTKTFEFEECAVDDNNSMGHNDIHQSSSKAPLSSKSLSSSPNHISPHKQLSPHLTRLLKRLRPFQREAFEYATGLPSSDCSKIIDGGDIKGDGDSGRKNPQQRKKMSIKKDEGNGMGRGRILLADEMGLGKLSFDVRSIIISLIYHHVLVSSACNQKS